MDTPEVEQTEDEKGFIYADPGKNQAALLGIFGGLIVVLVVTLKFLNDGSSIRDFDMVYFCFF